MLFVYHVEFYDEVTSEDTSEKGITCGNDIGDAANKITEWYGKNNVYSLKLTPYEQVITEEDITNLWD